MGWEPAGVLGDYRDTALLERWLEEKAVQGWRPVSFSRYGSGKFESAEPRKLRYRLEPLWFW